MASKINFNFVFAVFNGTARNAKIEYVACICALYDISIG